MKVSHICQFEFFNTTFLLTTKRQGRQYMHVYLTKKNMQEQNPTSFFPGFLHCMHQHIQLPKEPKRLFNTVTS